MLPHLGVVLSALLRGDDGLGDADGRDHPSSCEGQKRLAP